MVISSVRLLWLCVEVVISDQTAGTNFGRVSSDSDSISDSVDSSELVSSLAGDG